MAIHWRRPLTPLELGLYAGLCGVLIAVFLERALVYMELAERTAMEVTVQHVNSALHVQLALQMLQGRAIDAPKALERHPFELARMRVANLHPDVAGTERLVELERGYWVFETSGKELIYLPRLYRGLQTDGAQALVRFHLIAGERIPYVLVPASKYSWE